MNRRSRFAALRTRMVLVFLGVACGLAARWILGDPNLAEAKPSLKPIPDEFRQQVDGQDLLQTLEASE